MDKIRKYGNKPFSVVTVHGGPGAPGEMAPVARELSKHCGILEPLQSATSLEGQIVELKEALEDGAQLPVVLIGHSWGAFLSYIFTAKYPSLVRKLILVGSGPYKAEYTKDIMKTRLSRLDDKDRSEVNKIIKDLKNPDVKNKNKLFSRFGKLLAKADSYNVIPHKDEVLKCDSKIFQQVWTEAEKMRASGKLLKLGSKIQCPVVAIHGDYDPHPADGVKFPLSSTLKNFKFILLEKCGHDPWLEKNAKDQFFKELRKELGKT